MDLKTIAVFALAAILGCSSTTTTSNTSDPQHRDGPDVGNPSTPVVIPGALGVTSLAYGDVVDEGDLDVEGSFQAIKDNIDGGSGGDFTAFSAATPTGTASLRYIGMTSPYVRWILEVRGSDVLDNHQNFPTIGSNLPWRVGDLVRWRTWYRPSIGTSGIRIWVNNVAGLDVVGTTTGTLAEATSLTFGGSNPSALAASETIIGHSVLDRPDLMGPEIVCLGDSTLGRINPGVPEVIAALTDFYSLAERSTRPGVGLMAVGADTIAGQRAKWSTSWWRSSPSVKAVTVEVGINDVLASTSSSTIITGLQGLVDEIREDRPDVKIAIAEMTPIKGDLDTYYSAGTAAAMYTVWQDVNTSIKGGGGSPITGVDYRIVEHEECLNDGTGALKTAYSYDLLHENSDGRRDCVAPAYRTAFVGLGFLR